MFKSFLAVVVLTTSMTAMARVQEKSRLATWEKVADVKGLRTAAKPIGVGNPPDPQAMYYCTDGTSMYACVTASCRICFKLKEAKKD